MNVVKTVVHIATYTLLSLYLTNTSSNACKLYGLTKPFTAGYSQKFNRMRVCACAIHVITIVTTLFFVESLRCWRYTTETDKINGVWGRAV